MGHFFRAAAVFLLCVAGPAANARDIIALSITAFGEAPGIQAANLPGFLAEVLNEQPLTGFKFTPATEAETPPDRIEWRFKPNAYAFGLSRYLGPGRPHSDNLFGVHRLCSVETRLFRGGLYQKLVFGQVELTGGKNDAAFMRFIRQQAHILLDETGGAE